jgi:hypothetical protein
MKNLLENKYPSLKKLSILRKGISNEFLSFAGSQNYFREKAGLTFNLKEF